MLITLEIPDQQFFFFKELIQKLGFVTILKKEKNEVISDLSEAFNDVKLYQEGKKELKSANDLLNEL